MNPVSAPLIGGVDGNHIIEITSRGNTTAEWRLVGDLGKIEGYLLPFRDAKSAVHPRGRIEEHAMVMKGCGLIQAVGGMHDK